MLTAQQQTDLDRIKGVISKAFGSSGRPIDLVAHWTGALAKAEAALTAKREWLRTTGTAGTMFYSDANEVAQVESCKLHLARHAERAAREERVAARQVKAVA